MECLSVCCLVFCISPSVALAGVTVPFAMLAFAHCVDARGVAADSPCRVRYVVVSCNDFAVGGHLLHGSGVEFLASPFARAVVDVVLSVTPLQVVGSVVGLVLVLMVHVKPFLIAWHEGTGYEAMHKVGVCFSPIVSN